MERDSSLYAFYMEEMGKLGLPILRSFAAFTVPKELQQALIPDGRNIYFSLLLSLYLKIQFLAS